MLCTKTSQPHARFAPQHRAPIALGPSASCRMGAVCPTALHTHRPLSIRKLPHGRLVPRRTRLLRIHCPWSNPGGHWHGAWADGSAQWQATPEAQALEKVGTWQAGSSTVPERDPGASTQVQASGEGPSTGGRTRRGSWPRVVLPWRSRGPRAKAQGAVANG